MSTVPPVGTRLMRHDAAAAAQLVEPLADVYALARDEPPYQGNARWGRNAFVDRTHEQVARIGFELVTAHANEHIVGFAFGHPVEPGRWFQGDTEPAAEILLPAKFAVIELDVLGAWRNQGIGHAILDALLAMRPEKYAMLSTLPGTPVHEMYKRWGWRTVSHTLPHSGLPPWDTLVLRLSET